MPGPVPKRSDQRRRHTKPAIDITKAPSGGVIVIPEPDEDWHPAARRWYDSLGESGQSVYYQSSDWATAFIWAEVISRALRNSRLSSQLIMAWQSGATDLLATEGSRRRLRMELDRARDVDPDETSAVSDMDSFRARFQPSNDGGTGA